MSVIYEPRGAAREYAPLACNLYAGCTHGCLYCYAPDCVHRDRQQFHAEATPRANIIAALEKDLHKGQWRGMGRVLFCFTTDPYQPAEEEFGITRQALAAMARYQAPFEVLTKGGMRACRDFLFYRNGRGTFGTTLAFTNDTMRRDWEPGAASIDNRMAAIAEAHQRGIRTWVSVEPVIDPAQVLELIPELGYCVDEWRIGKLNHHAHAKTVDWATFAVQVQDLLMDSGKDFLIKDALAAFLPTSRKHLIRRETPESIRQEVATTLF
jgi:DNA repair photolyase